MNLDVELLALPLVLIFCHIPHYLRYQACNKAAIPHIILRG
jgi:hypothetical protein